MYVLRYDSPIKGVFNPSDVIMDAEDLAIIDEAIGLDSDLSEIAALVFDNYQPCPDGVFAVCPD